MVILKNMGCGGSSEKLKENDQQSANKTGSTKQPTIPPGPVTQLNKALESAFKSNQKNG